MFSHGRQAASLAPALFSSGPPARPEPLPTGLALDAILPGGFLRGQLSEICGPASSGKRSLALSVCLRAIDLGQNAAWIAPGPPAKNLFYPLPALEAGLPVDRLLVVRVPDGRSALKAAALILRSAGAVLALVVDLEGERSAPEAHLARLRHLAQEGACAVLLLTSRPQAGPALSTFISLRLALERVAGGQGFAVRASVVKNKFGPANQRAEVALDGPDRLRVDSSV